MVTRSAGAVVSAAAGYAGGLLGLVAFWYLGNGLSTALGMESRSTSMIPISPLALLLAGLGGLVLMMVAVAYSASLLRGGPRPWIGTGLGALAGLVVWGLISASRGEVGTGLLALPPAAAIVAWLFPNPVGTASDP